MPAIVPPLAARIAAIRRAARSLVAALAGSVRASAAQRGEAAGVAGPGHLGGEVLRDCRSQQPRQAGPDDIAADQREHPAAQGDEIGPGVAAGPAGVAQPCPGQLPPRQVARGVGAAGHPPLLPGAAGLLLEPVQQLGQADPPAGLHVIPAGGERRREQPRQHVAAPLAGHRPVRLERARAGTAATARPSGPRTCRRHDRGPWPRRPRLRAGRPGRAVPHGWSWRGLPNSTSSDSGRYRSPGGGSAPGDRSLPAAIRAWWASTLAITSLAGADM